MQKQESAAPLTEPVFLVLLSLAQAPRHGYEIIKLVEEKTADWYSPSPGIVYPTLTYLEEAGYVTGQTIVVDGGVSIT